MALSKHGAYPQFRWQHVEHGDCRLHRFSPDIPFGGVKTPSLFAFAAEYLIVIQWAN